MPGTQLASAVPVLRVFDIEKTLGLARRGGAFQVRCAIRVMGGVRRSDIEIPKLSTAEAEWGGHPGSLRRDVRSRCRASQGAVYEK